MSENPNARRLSLFLFLGTLLLISAAALAFLYFAAPPALQEGGVNLVVSRGMSVQSIAQEAKQRGIVRSSLLLSTILTKSYDPTKIYAGTYRFEKAQSVFEVARKLASTEVDDTLRTLTIPEGTTRESIASIAQAAIPSFDAEAFLAITENKEGYLFPDTYFVPEEFTAQELADLLMETYHARVEPLNDVMASSTFSEYEVLILASILEREANSEESMRMVSGILQNRLEIGMALQTDASIEYALHKPLSELTSEDLDMDTPYNTYLYPGLVPTPIGNPGLTAIEAVLHPEHTEYFYYITGDDGNFYYAKTFDEHKANIARYLR